MSTTLPEESEVLDAIRGTAKTLGRPPSRSEFKSSSGMSEYQVLRFFLGWREAVRAAGLEPYSANTPVSPEALLEDWADVVRRLRRIPTREAYRREGTFSPSGFASKLGPWSNLPAKFREFAEAKPEWSDVLALLPLIDSVHEFSVSTQNSDNAIPTRRNLKLTDRPTYGNPIDFRGLRHEPVNEDGVIFLFGMVARELGYLVEAVQAGYPDCEAKCQIDVGKWQRVRIEFEFESRNFRDHGHPPNGCDVIVCWRHNWPDCPSHLEIVELCNVIRTLSSSDD